MVLNVCYWSVLGWWFVFIEILTVRPKHWIRWLQVMVWRCWLRNTQTHHTRNSHRHITISKIYHTALDLCGHPYLQRKTTENLEHHQKIWFSITQRKGVGGGSVKECSKKSITHEIPTECSALAQINQYLFIYRIHTSLHAAICTSFWQTFVCVCANTSYGFHLRVNIY